MQAEEYNLSPPNEGFAEKKEKNLVQVSITCRQRNMIYHHQMKFLFLKKKEKKVKVSMTCRHRGLCQLMKARGVNTIGNLASLTEVAVQNMPVRAPKVKTVKEALTTFHSQHYAKKSEPSPSSESLASQQGREDR